MTQTKSRILIFAIVCLAFVAQGFGKTSTSVSLASSLNPSTYGDAVIFTATVTPSSAGGSVTFTDGTTTLGSASLSGGVATYSTSALAPGSHSITATYNGSSLYDGSTSSPPITQVVNPTPTSVSLTATPNPSTFGTTVMFTASVSPMAATGTVTFKDGSTTLGTSSLSGGTAKLASYETSALVAGSHSITATYNGNSNYASSTSSALSQVVNKASPTITLASSVNPSTYGSPVTFTATVSSSLATGTVTFFDAGSQIGSGTLNSGVATLTTSALVSASHSITASYAGDANDNSANSSALGQVVNKAGNTVTLSSSSNPSTYAVSVTFTATVSPSLATGTVTFLDGGTTLGTGTINNGTASYSTSTLLAASHSITATYAGDANDNGGSSSPLTQVVNGATTSVQIASSANPSTYDVLVTFTATVSSLSATGTVTFLDGNTTLGTGTLTSGTATYGTSSLNAGAHLITVVYGGDSNYSGSTSSPLTQTVNQANTSITLSSSQNPSTYGLPVTFTATVTPSAATGTVAFIDSGTTLGTSTITGGAASYVTSTLATGANSVTASYSGDANDNGSTSSALVQNVNQSQCSSGYQYSQAIVLNHLMVPNSDQTDFPALISGTYSFLAMAPNGGQVQSSAGYDIVFCADAAGTTQLDHEIDTYNPQTGAVNFWVRIPTLSHATDTTIYMFYGNPNVNTSQENKPGVWKNNYLSVYHLGNGAALGLSDSVTTDGFLLNSIEQTGFQPSPGIGEFGGALALAGDPNTYLYEESVAGFPSGTSPVTIEAWFQLATSTGGFDMVGYGDNSGNGARVALGWDGSNGQLEFENMDVSGPLPFDTNWHQLVGVYGGGALTLATSQLYLDGSLISNATTGGTPAITTTEFRIGGIPTVDTCCAMNGSVDEVRVSSGTRSADWVATEYANQSAPWAFYTINTTGGLPTPAVATLTPSSGTGNTTVTIKGSNFGATQGSSSVSFNGSAPDSISSWSNSQIVAVTPLSVTTGPVTVTVNSVTSNSNVYFTANNPLITSLSPPAAPLGTYIVIYGYGFGQTQGSSYAMFSGSLCNIQNWSDNAIEVIVPSAATSGPVTVTVNGITSNGADFTVEVPAGIGTISPVNGSVGTVVTINGSGFGSVQSDSTVAFDGTPATEVTYWSDNQIIATVPATASGPVSVTVAGNTVYGPTFMLDTVAILTNSLGYQTTYNSTMIGGTWELLSAQGPGCSTCSVRNNVQNTYDGNGNLLTTTDANGNTITYTYDAGNHVLSESAQLNGQAVTTSYTYNSFGEVLTVTDALNNTTTNTYDSHGNLLSITTPAPDMQTPASVTQFGYNNLGELTQITDPLGHSTYIQYYPTGLIQSITDAQNNVTSYAYDARGNRTSVIDPINGSGHPTTFSYDVMNRLTGITYPDNTSVGFGYDYRGRRTTATDQNNHTTHYGYDDADRLLSITDPANNVTQFGYDSEGQLTSITDANHHTTAYAYDPFGRVIKTNFPSSLIETYGYDPVGNLTSKTDRKGQTIQYFYDALYRLTYKVYPDSTSANYIYDLVGKLRQVTDSTGTYGFAYDNMGRLIGTTTQYSLLPGYNLQNGYTYDAASNRTSMTTPDGTTNSYNYDTLNRLGTLTSSLTGQFGFGYDALSRRTQMTRPNGVSTTYSYDAVSNLLSVLHNAGSTTFDGSSYGYDQAGNKLSNTNYLSGSTSNYGYDALYELSSVTGVTNESYGYDAVGNRLSSAGTPSYSYNASNELTSTSNGTYGYDANGNMISDPSGKQYTWDFENRLSQVVVPGTGTVVFKYDPFGRRIYKNSPSFAGIFAYDGYNLIETMSSSGSLLARYTMTENIDEPLAMLRSSGSGYYEADGLGSITSLTDSSGSVANTYAYDSFGNLASFSGSLRNPFLYTGREYDNEVGLYFDRFRYYNPQNGRFIGEDPIRFVGGINFYGYVFNNATNLIDPFGLCGKNMSNSVNCNTVLPDGQTIGQVVRQYRSWLEGALSEPVAWPFETESLFYDIVKSNGPIDFKNIFRGQNKAATLGQAGNFAYYAIGTGFLPNWELDAGASAYALKSTALRRKSFSSLTSTGPWIVDDSAASVRDAALASNGCQQ